MIPLESKVAYGPVRSRRFGWDLGINLLPTDRKICNFDCPYCQYGENRRGDHTPLRFPDERDVIREWSDCIQDCRDRGIQIAHTTVAGNGEPTLHPQFPTIAREIIEYRNRVAPELKLALLSNGTRLLDPRIRAATLLFDEPVLKLDAGTSGKLQLMNRPLARFVIRDYIKALQLCNRFLIQTMFLKGLNDAPEDIDAWIRLLDQIHPVEVQIYTLSRSPAQSGLISLTADELSAIAWQAAQRTGLRVIAY